MGFTSESPHSCEHCQQITIDLGLDETTIQFRCGTKQVAAAYQDGCQLFHAFIASLGKMIRVEDLQTTNRNLSFHIYYEKEGLPQVPAYLILGVSETLEDGTVEEFLGLGGLQRLSLWTDKSNPAAVDISTRPYELDPASPTSIEFARCCIESCMNDHEQCRRPVNNIMSRQGQASIDSNSIPSRLLHLVANDSEFHVQLIDWNSRSAIEKETVCLEGYAILSYCWGGSQPIQLTRDNFKALKEGVPVAQLPKSLRDAAWFTNKIGLKYLWIDSLCIIQDDSEDKVYEISRMELYYGQSTVTICAASAASCSEGFIMPREEDTENYKFGPINLRAKNSLGTLGSVQAVAEFSFPSDEKVPEPIVLRGWTLQESMLSSRILIFSSHYLHFTCTVANSSCGGFEPMLRPRFMTQYESQIPKVHTISGFRDYPVTHVWRYLIDDYTERGLGFLADKLPAVSALASSLIPMGKERNQKLVYLAGLMVDISDPENYSWRNEFLWRVHKMHSTSHIPTGSPSWSWSSLSGRVIMCKRFPYTFGWNIAEEGDTRKICEYKVELENEMAPFGAVKGGFVKLRARIKELSTIEGHNFNIATESNPGSMFAITDYVTLTVIPDTGEGMCTINRGINGEQRVFLVELVPFYESGDTPTGLIVTNAAGTDRYVRVGIFEYRHPENNQNVEDLALRKDLFDGSKFEYVQII
ncbi:HET-domain-containing protein [Annulohypoxylon maeteangense]|uniref:HET-domain-containing protein n=1 Tax=Annulohypoxylon maeteangense TaxID=1927788 RepID=UPI002007D0E9|nr:HET-domain-containing protein [Annulohypoxylon maeteangense]KAI0882942.1 HET-domain-containing protein [Annulohypoxylon maeteangense]